MVFCILSSLAAQGVDFSTLKNLNIRNLVPANMSGRITAIDVVMDNLKIMLLGDASGGIWRLKNGGSAW